MFFLNFDCNNILDFNCKAHLIIMIYLHVNLRYTNNKYYYLLLSADNKGANKQVG